MFGPAFCAVSRHSFISEEKDRQSNIRSIRANPVFAVVAKKTLTFTSELAFDYE
jgi:hypothetical protein